MKRRSEDWTVEKIGKERERISFPEYQREKDLWSDEKKSLLIDSILCDIDIPKLYFNERTDRNIEVIDGQQRLWAVWEFLDDIYGYSIGREESRKYSQLLKEERDHIDHYKFQITLYKDADEDYLRKLFVRLQLGLLLNAGERLNANTGKMKDFVFGDMAVHRFIASIGVTERRFAKETLCAQIAINAFSLHKVGKFYRTRYDDLNSFFTEYSSPAGSEAVQFNRTSKKIRERLDWLSKCFGSDSGRLNNRSYILSLVLFVYKEDLPEAEQSIFKKFSLHLWKRLRDEAKLGMDRGNRELYSFQSYLSSAPGEQYQIERRHMKLRDYFVHYKNAGKIIGD